MKHIEINKVIRTKKLHGFSQILVYGWLGNNMKVSYHNRKSSISFLVIPSNISGFGVITSIYSPEWVLKCLGGIGGVSTLPVSRSISSIYIFRIFIGSNPSERDIDAEFK
jgi:hypothetical protein